MRTLNDYFLYGKIVDVSTAGQIYIAVPDGGTIVKVFTALNGAIITADVDITIKTAEGTAGVITIATSGSAVGDVDTLLPTSNNGVLEGGVIEVETDGESGNTVSVEVCIVVRR